MARHSFLLSLITGILPLLSYTTAQVEITDIFTVQGGRRDGGCEDRMRVLDQWLSETLYSIDTALNRMDTYDQDIRVRRAMSIFFGIQNAGKLERVRPVPQAQGPRRAAFDFVRDNIDYVNNFLNHRKKNDGGFIYKKENFHLHCDSTFLSLYEPTDPALDFQANEMQDEDGNTILIQDIPVYQKELAKDPDNRVFWSGDLTDQNGYYFTESGANICDDGDLGGTADLKILLPRENGEDKPSDTNFNVILCPSSFGNTGKPASYLAANSRLANGVSLVEAVPESATFLHEMFHAIHGGDFLGGNSEKYDLGQCLDLVRENPKDARKNPENYVFFIAHMYHLFGEDEGGGDPTDIPRNWDFQFMKINNVLQFAAFSNPS